MGLYRVTLAHYLGGHCRFDPSCSVHAQAALRRHGVCGGLARAAHQLLRCHPLRWPTALPRPRWRGALRTPPAPET